MRKRRRLPDRLLLTVADELIYATRAEMTQRAFLESVQLDFRQVGRVNLEVRDDYFAPRSPPISLVLYLTSK